MCFRHVHISIVNQKYIILYSSYWCFPFKCVYRCYYFFLWLYGKIFRRDIKSVHLSLFWILMPFLLYALHNNYLSFIDTIIFAVVHNHVCIRMPNPVTKQRFEANDFHRLLWPLTRPQHLICYGDALWPETTTACCNQRSQLLWNDSCSLYNNLYHTIAKIL